MTYTRHLTVLMIVVTLLMAAAPAQAQDTDKSGYTILNPTPRELWRPLEADRPDATESPRTVDAGAVQLELGFFQYTHDSRNSSADTTSTLELLGPSNLRVGVLNNAEFQIIFTPYVREETTPDGTTATTVAEGPSDLTLRFKVNLWGNDDGSTALGVLPFITIPTGSSVSSDHVEGGVALPFGWDFAEGFSLGLMAELDAVFSDVTTNTELAFLTTAVVGFDIYGPLGGYVEYVGFGYFTGGLPYEASASFGLTYLITSDVQLDGGALIGLTRAADDLVIFTGITIRF